MRRYGRCRIHVTPVFEPVIEFQAGANREFGRVVLLDRDGVLIQEKHYLKDPAAAELIPGVDRALRRLLDAGSFLAVVSNQAGVARGMLNLADVAGGFPC